MTIVFAAANAFPSLKNLVGQSCASPLNHRPGEHQSYTWNNRFDSRSEVNQSPTEATALDIVNFADYSMHVYED